MSSVSCLRLIVAIQSTANARMTQEKLLAELKGEDREILAEQMRPHLPVLKAGGVGKKGSAIERLVSALSTSTNGTTNHTPEDHTPALTPPASPGSMGGD